MRAVISIIGVLAILVFPALSTSGEKGIVADGELWRALPPAQKNIFISGILEGMALAAAECDKDVCAKDLLNTALGISVEEMVDAIDKIYVDVANEAIPVISLVRVVGQRMNDIISVKQEAGVIQWLSMAHPK